MSFENAPVRLGEQLIGWLASGAILVLALLYSLIAQPSLFVNDAIGGFMFGMILVLIALGLSLILGMMNVVNFGHGALFMLGGYIAYQIVARSHLSFWAALIVAPLALGVIGIVIEILILRPIYDQEPIVGLLATYGMTLIVQTSVIAIWGSVPKTYNVPGFLSTSTNLGITSEPTFRLFVAGLGVVVTVVIYLLVMKTQFGLTIRAGVQDSEMTSFLGVNMPIRFTAMFFIGLAIAGLAGTLRGAEVGLTPGLGQQYLTLAFIVVVVGGVGSLFGSVISGLVVGEAMFLAPVVFGSFAIAARHAGYNTLAAVLGVGSIGHLMPYLIMIVVLLVRPRGLFGQEGLLE